MLYSAFRFFKITQLTNIAKQFKNLNCSCRSTRQSVKKTDTQQTLLPVTGQHSVSKEQQLLTSFKHPAVLSGCFTLRLYNHKQKNNNNAI